MSHKHCNNDCGGYNSCFGGINPCCLLIAAAIFFSGRRRW